MRILTCPSNCGILGLNCILFFFLFQDINIFVHHLFFFPQKTEIESLCHPNFDVTIQPNSWELIAVEGYEYENLLSVGGTYGQTNSSTGNNMCRSASKRAFITFNLQVQIAS